MLKNLFSRRKRKLLHGVKNCVSGKINLANEFNGIGRTKYIEEVTFRFVNELSRSHSMWGQIFKKYLFIQKFQ